MPAAQLTLLLAARQLRLSRRARVPPGVRMTWAPASTERLLDSERQVVRSKPDELWAAGSCSRCRDASCQVPARPLSTTQLCCTMGLPAARCETVGTARRCRLGQGRSVGA